MGFDAVIRAGVAVADALTKQGLQATVAHASHAGVNAYGEPTYSAPVNRRAVVADTRETIRTDEGAEVVARYRITLLEAVAVGSEDKITLPSGVVTPILRVDAGVLDDAGSGFVTEVWCG